MELKTDVRINLDLHFTSDDFANETELARLAAVADSLYLLMKAGGREAPAATEPKDLLPHTVPAIEAAEPQTEDITEASAGEPPARRRHQMPASRSWSFKQFDAAVRAEMQRLADHGEMPTTTRWDQERSPDLPTLTAVIRRYDATNMADLAQKLGLRPAGVRPGPAPAAAPVSNNGAAGRHL